MLGSEVMHLPMQIKTPEELRIMQYANDIASAAHVEVRRQSDKRRIHVSGLHNALNVAD